MRTYACFAIGFYTAYFVGHAMLDVGTVLPAVLLEWWFPFEVLLFVLFPFVLGILVGWTSRDRP